MSIEQIGSKWLIEYDDSGWNTLAAIDPKIMEELKGHEEASFSLKNTAANRTIVAEDRTVRFSYDGEEIWRGTLAAVEYYSETLKCVVYNDTYETMKKRVIYSTYPTTSLPTLLGYVCNAAGVAAGTCPAGTVSVRFENSLCYDAGRFLALIAQSDFWAEGGTFNVGVRDNCVLCLPFEENAGTVTADLSGYGNTGTLYGSMSWVTGKYGYALNFGSVANDRVETSFDGFETGDKITVVCWAKPNVIDSSERVLIDGKEDTILRLELNASDKFAATFGSGAGWVGAVTSSTTPQVGTYYHVAAVWDGSYMRLYVNGVEEGTPYSWAGNVTAPTAIVLGKYGAGAGYEFNGHIDEVKIYKRALTAEEIKFLYNIGLGRVSVRKIDRSKRRDKIIVKGKDEDGNVIWGSAGTGTDAAVFRENKAADETTLDLLAADKLAELDTDTNQLEIHLKPQHGALLHAGDIIPIVSTEMDVMGNYRIYRITKTPEDVTVEPERKFKKTEEILAELQSFEELGVIVNPELTPSDNAHWPNDTERYNEETSYTKIKEIVLGADLNGTVRIKFDLKAVQVYEADPAAVYAKIYRNGTAIGTQCETDSGDYLTFHEDLNTGWETSGSMQIYAYGLDLIGTQRSHPYIRNMRICYDPDAYYSHTNNDP